MQLPFEVVAELKRLEETLLRPEIRRSGEKMSALLADDFMEYGRSGRIYDEAAILETVDKAFDGQLSLHEFSAKALAPLVALVRTMGSDGRWGQVLRFAPPARAIRRLMRDTEKRVEYTNYKAFVVGRTNRKELRTRIDRLVAGHPGIDSHKFLMPQSCSSIVTGARSQDAFSTTSLGGPINVLAFPAS